MSRYRRVRLKGGQFFFTVITYQRRPILTTELGIECLRHAWRETNTTMPFGVEAVCVLPDHLHTVWSLPEDDTDYPARWRKIKGIFSRKFRAHCGPLGEPNPSRQRRREVNVWQRRYWEHRIRNEHDFRRHVEYVHFNPVKHGHVTTLAEWPWSSFHDHVKKGWIEPDWGIIEPDDFDCIEAGE